MAAYLDDILIKNTQRQVLESDRDFLLEVVWILGCIFSMVKSDLRPKLQFDHRGMIFDTQTYTVGLTLIRINKLMGAALQLRAASLTSRRGIARMVGLCQAAVELLPLGRLRLRSLQWAVFHWLRRWQRGTNKYLFSSHFYRPYSLGQT